MAWQGAADDVLDVADDLIGACAICFKDYTEASTIIFPCGSHPPHVFCRECIASWRKIAYTCPLCRGVASGNFVLYDEDGAKAGSPLPDDADENRGRRRRRRGPRGNNAIVFPRSAASSSAEAASESSDSAARDIFSVDSAWMPMPGSLHRVREFLSKHWNINDGTIAGCDGVPVLGRSSGIDPKAWLVAHYGRFPQLGTAEQQSAVKRCQTLAKRSGVLPLGRSYFTLPYRNTQSGSTAILRHQVGWRTHDGQLMFRRVTASCGCIPNDMKTPLFSVQEILVQNTDGETERLPLSDKAIRQLRRFDEPQAVKFVNDLQSSIGKPASMAFIQEDGTVVGTEGLPNGLIPHTKPNVMSADSFSETETVLSRVAQLAPLLQNIDDDTSRQVQAIGSYAWLDDLSAFRINATHFLAYVWYIKSCCANAGEIVDIQIHD